MNLARARILWKVKTMLNAMVFFVFNNFSETPCMKVGLEVRISLVCVLSTGEGREEASPLSKKGFSCKKLKAISNTDHI